MFSGDPVSAGFADSFARRRGNMTGLTFLAAEFNGKRLELLRETIPSLRHMTRFSSVEIDFIADDPGPSLLHCHHQDHQDEGFMGLVTYL
jgi:FtsP/CotA-like multicopper oxidase with cupredoxin domain